MKYTHSPTKFQKKKNKMKDKEICCLNIKRGKMMIINDGFDG